MASKFTYDDTVRVVASAPIEFRPGATAWVVGVFEGAEVPKYRSFKVGPVYCIEFEDGQAIDVEEEFLEIVPPPAGA